MSDKSKTRLWAALALLCALRWAQIGAPMIGDEAFMVRTYAAKAPAYAAAHYQTTNNHFLLSLLLHGIDAVSPKRLLVTLAHPWPLQLPSLLAAMLALLLVCALARELYGETAAWAAAAVYGLAYYPLLYAHMLRGYALSSALLLALIFALRRGGRALWGVPALVAALHYLVPSNVYFTLPLAGWALWRGGPRERMRVGAAFAAGGVLTLALLWPVLGQMRQRAADLNALIENGDAARLASWFGVLGRHLYYRVLLAVAGAAGAWALWRERRRAEWLLPLALTAAPLLLMTLHRQAPYPRHFLPGFAGWALLVGAAAAAALRHRPRATALSALLLLAAVPEVGAFLHWNRSYDLRGAFAQVTQSTRREDDFAVVVAAEPPHGEPEALSWEYYAIAANMPPNAKVFYGGLPAYKAPRTLYLLTTWQPRQARRVGGAGRLQVWRRDLADEAHAAMRRGEYADAAARLREMHAARPKDPAVLHRLGAALMLDFKHEAAVAALRAAIAADPSNPDAPFFLADTLAALGRREEAARWYDWYDFGKVKGTWDTLRRVGRARAAAQSGADPRPRTAAEWDALAVRAGARGAHERALAALERAERLAPSPQRSGRFVEQLMAARRFARAAETLRALAKTHPGVDVYDALAEVLYRKYDEDGARAAVAASRKLRPGSERARNILRRIERG